jgi:hypothetical protein
VYSRVILCDLLLFTGIGWHYLCSEIEWGLGVLHNMHIFRKSDHKSIIQRAYLVAFESQTADVMQHRRGRRGNINGLLLCIAIRSKRVMARCDGTLLTWKVTFSIPLWAPHKSNMLRLSCVEIISFQSLISFKIDKYKCLDGNFCPLTALDISSMRGVDCSSVIFLKDSWETRLA